jgi:hypothetical protein
MIIFIRFFTGSDIIIWIEEFNKEPINEWLKNYDGYSEDEEYDPKGDISSSESEFDLDDDGDESAEENLLQGEILSLINEGKSRPKLNFRLKMPQTTRLTQVAV